MRVRVLPIWTAKKLKETETCPIISTVSKSDGVWKQLSPFILGPCNLYRRNGKMLKSQNMENAWQYSKLYKDHADKDGEPTSKYWKWAKEGWANSRAVRYPMGKGRKPLCSIWPDDEGELAKMDYITARKCIYAPLYSELVKETEAYKELQRILKEHKELILLDFDAYDHHKEGMTLSDVLNNPRKKAGHAFILAMMLTRDEALKQIRDMR